MNDPEKPTAQTEAAARPQNGPPPQLGGDWVHTADPQDIEDAFVSQRLHSYLGGQVDAEGWPVDDNGKRLPATRKGFGS